MKLPPIALAAALAVAPGVAVAGHVWAVPAMAGTQEYCTVLAHDVALIEHELHHVDVIGRKVHYDGMSLNGGPYQYANQRLWKDALTLNNELQQSGVLPSSATDQQITAVADSYAQTVARWTWKPAPKWIHSAHRDYTRFQELCNK